MNVPALSLGLVGAPVEEGAGRPGCIMGPAALRTAGLPEMLSGLGHQVRDFGDVAVLRGEMQPAMPFASRNAGLLAQWTGAIHDATLSVLADGFIFKDGIIATTSSAKVDHDGVTFDHTGNNAYYAEVEWSSENRMAPATTAGRF